MGTLEIGGISARKLADTYGTPLYVYDEAKIEEQLLACMDNFKSECFDTEIVYASKAFSCKALFEKVRDAGGSLDVVSGGELFLADKAGMPMNRVYFHGNNKTVEELELAFDLSVGTIVLDNRMESQKVIELSKKRKQKMDVMLRINPGIEAHTHEYIMTAHSDSKFGISSEKKEEIRELVREVLASEYVDFKGFHSHIGSQIFELEAFCKAASLLVAFTEDMQVKCGFIADYLSLGGGFGIKYVAGDKPMDLSELCGKLAGFCEEEVKKAGLSLKKIMIEPGRAIVGEAGYTIYTVGWQKKTKNKHYVFVDGGMSDNIRPALYQAEYACDIAERVGSPKPLTVCVAGKNCESGDVLIKETELQETREGDLLVMYATGAYGYAMASNYNRLGRPAVVFAKEGADRLVIRRETYEDLLYLET